MARNLVNPVQVTQYQSLRAIKIDAAATYGAQIGVDLLMPDGSVSTVAKLQGLFGAGTGTSGGPGTTDELDEGAFNLYFTDKRAQSAVGDILENTANVTLTYDGGGNTIKADLTATGVSAGTYGDSTHVPVFTIDIKGRVTNATTAVISGGGGGAGEILVADGSSAPPVMLTNEAEDDFLYEG